MTLIVALACEDGVVLAADSASSEDVGTKMPVCKVNRIGELPIIWGGSGNVSVLQKMESRLEHIKMKNRFEATIGEIKGAVCQIQKEALDGHVPYPGRPYETPPAGIALFAAVHDQQPWVFEIERNGEDTVMDDRYGRFAAAGSGKIFAHAIARPYLFHQPRSLRVGQCIAYRVVQDSIALASAGLCEPIEMAWVDRDGHVSSLENNERQAIEHACGVWRSIELESLGRALSPQPAAEAAPMPTPQD